MENSPWRLIFIAAGASLFLLLFTYVIILPKKPLSEKETQKIASFKTTHVAGHEEGKKIWEFNAQSGWVEKNNRITHLENVSEGILYKNNDVITKNLTAGEVKAYQNSKIIEAFGNDKKQLSANITFAPKNKNKKRKFAAIEADYLNYNPDLKKTIITGSVGIIEKNMNIRTNELAIDHEKETADLHDEVKIDRGDIFLTCVNLYYDANQEKFNASNDIKSQIKGKQKAVFNGQQMAFFVDPKKDMEASNSVEVVQGKKSAVSDAGTYNKTTGIIHLAGRVKAVIVKGKDLLKENSIAKLHNADARKLLEEKTFITADNLSLSTKNSDAKAEGNVFVYQGSREAKANHAVYSDAAEIITLTDNVYLKREKNWVKCKKVEVSVKDETFTAFGSVEAEFRIKK